MAEDMTFLPRRELLTLEELDRLCSAFIEMGTRKIRITGGEPLVRRDIMGLFRSLSRHLEAGTLQEITLTTNGSQLARFADELASCGVRRINVSLDTLDPARFKAITRRGDLDRVLTGIDAAQRAGTRGENQRRCAQRGQRRRIRTDGPMGALAEHGDYLHRGHAAWRDRNVALRPAPAADKGARATRSAFQLARTPTIAPADPRATCGCAKPAA